MALGFIGAAISAIGGNLKDQWKDAVMCEDMPNNVLMMRKTSKTGVISHGSSIIVNPGQIAVIVSGGRVVDATAQEGVYRYEEGAPSFFAGDFGASFKDMWTRFTYGGGRPLQDSVYYINATEILDNGFGTAAPVMYRDWEHAVMNARMGIMQPMKVDVKCFGKYTFKIADPAVFMSKVAGTAEIFRKDEIIDQMRSEVIGSFQNVLNELGNSNHKTPVLELPSSTDEIKKVMDEKVFDQPIRDRGLSIVGFVVESVTLDEDSEKKIDNYELSSNSFMQQGTLVGAYANAVQDAANNAGGAMNGFMGVGMMNMASGGVFGGAVQNAQAPQAAPATQAYNPYEGQNSQGQPLHPGVVAHGENAEELADDAEVPAQEAAPAEEAKPMAFCPNCGTKNNGSNFCGNCGTKLK